MDSTLAKKIAKILPKGAGVICITNHEITVALPYNKNTTGKGEVVGPMTPLGFTALISWLMDHPEELGVVWDRFGEHQQLERAPAEEIKH